MTQTPVKRYFRKNLRHPGILRDRGTYSQELFMEEMLDFIRTNKDEPFFIYFPTQIPHGRSPDDGDEIQLPDIGPYGDRDWTHLEKLYAACVTRLDTDIGRILRKLKTQGIDENTLILFTSDNGDENSYYKYTQRFADPPSSSPATGSFSDLHPESIFLAERS